VFELLRKMTLVGIGALSLTKEKAEQLAKELAEKGQASAEEARHFIQELMERGQKEREELRSRMASEIGRYRDEWDLARRSEVLDLQARVRRLEERVFGTATQQAQPASGVDEQPVTESPPI
jgi:polyhydroxyalkanoate synthesis regulator phasin